LTDGQLFNSGDADDVADGCFLCRNTLQTFDLVQGDDLGTVGNVWIMEVADNDRIVNMQSTAGDTADTDSADKIVVVNGGDQHLCRTFWIAFRSRNFFQDGVEQDVQVFALYAWFTGSGSFFTGAVEDLAFQLFLVCIQIKQQVVNFF